MGSAAVCGLRRRGRATRSPAGRNALHAGALLPRRDLREVHALPDPRVRGQRLDLHVLGRVGEHLARLAERILELRELFDDTRVPLEELGELVFAQLPR